MNIQRERYAINPCETATPEDLNEFLEAVSNAKHQIGNPQGVQHSPYGDSKRIKDRHQGTKDVAPLHASITTSVTVDQIDAELRNKGRQWTRETQQHESATTYIYSVTTDVGPKQVATITYSIDEGLWNIRPDNSPAMESTTIRDGIIIIKNYVQDINCRWTPRVTFRYEDHEQANLTPDVFKARVWLFADMVNQIHESAKITYEQASLYVLAELIAINIGRSNRQDLIRQNNTVLYDMRYALLALTTQAKGTGARQVGISSMGTSCMDHAKEITFNAGDKIASNGRRMYQISTQPNHKFVNTRLIPQQAFRIAEQLIASDYQFEKSLLKNREVVYLQPLDRIPPQGININHHHGQSQTHTLKAHHESIKETSDRTWTTQQLTEIMDKAAQECYQGADAQYDRLDTDNKLNTIMHKLQCQPNTEHQRKTHFAKLTYARLLYEHTITHIKDRYDTYAAPSSFSIASLDYVILPLIKQKLQEYDPHPRSTSNQSSHKRTRDGEEPQALPPNNRRAWTHLEHR